MHDLRKPGGEQGLQALDRELARHPNAHFLHCPPGVVDLPEEEAVNGSLQASSERVEDGQDREREEQGEVG